MTDDPTTSHADALEFIGRAFRNIDLPPLSADDLRDISEALQARAPIEASEAMVEKVADVLFTCGLQDRLGYCRQVARAILKAIGAS